MASLACASGLASSRYVKKKPCEPSAKYHRSAHAGAGLLGVRAVPRVSDHHIVRSTTIGMASVERTFVEHGRRFESGNRIDGDRGARLRPEQVILRDHLTAALDEEFHGHRHRRVVRIRDQDVGVEERTRRSFREEVGQLDRCDHHVVAGAAGIRDAEHADRRRSRTRPPAIRRTCRRQGRGRRCRSA